MAKGLKEQGYAGVDINMGCPAKDVVKTGGGSGLIATPELAAEIIGAAKESGLPVSVKTRLGIASTDEPKSGCNSSSTTSTPTTPSGLNIAVRVTATSSL